MTLDAKVRQYFQQLHNTSWATA